MKIIDHFWFSQAGRPTIGVVCFVQTITRHVRDEKDPKAKPVPVTNREVKMRSGVATPRTMREEDARGIAENGTDMNIDVLRKLVQTFDDEKVKERQEKDV